MVTDLATMVTDLVTTVTDLVTIVTDLVTRVISYRCGENVVALSRSQLDISVSCAALACAQALVQCSTEGGSSKAVTNWLQAILLEITCFYSYMCDRNSNWNSIIQLLDSNFLSGVYIEYLVIVSYILYSS